MSIATATLFQPAGIGENTDSGWLAMAGTILGLRKFRSLIATVKF